MAFLVSLDPKITEDCRETFVIGEGSCSQYSVRSIYLILGKSETAEQQMAPVLLVPPDQRDHVCLLLSMSMQKAKCERIKR